MVVCFLQYELTPVVNIIYNIEYSMARYIPASADMAPLPCRKYMLHYDECGSVRKGH